MTLPTLAIKVDWNADADFTDTYDDITADVLEMSWDRGASFDGGADPPGSCTLIVRNDDGRYNIDNASGRYYGNLKPGRSVWAVGTYAGTAYGLFFGHIRRIVQRGDRLAEIYAEDPLQAYDRIEAHVAYSSSTSLRSFRSSLLTAAGSGTAYQTLAYGVECDIPVTWADGISTLDALGECNTATGSLHFIQPGTAAGTPYRYKTIDRGALLAATSSETWANAYIVDLSGYDVTDESIVNWQRVTPTGRTNGANQTVWEFDHVPFGIAAAGQRTIWADFDDPVNSAALVYTALDYDDSTGATSTYSGTATMTAYAQSAKVVLQASAGTAARITSLSITGEPWAAANGAGVVVESSASQADYGVRLGWGQLFSRRIRPYGPRVRPTIIERKGEIASEFLAGDAAAEGLGSWYVFRYKDPKPRPVLTKQDHFPSMLAREVGDLVTLNFDELDISGKRYYIRAFQTTASAAEGTWRTQYMLEEAPAADTWFTLDAAGYGLDDAGAGSEGKLAY